MHECIGNYMNVLILFASVKNHNRYSRCRKIFSSTLLSHIHLYENEQKANWLLNYESVGSVPAKPT